MFWTNALIDILLFFFVVDCMLMCLVILMQRSKQEGLGAAFGGGLTESVWGAQTSNVLVKGTVWMAAIFFILSISLARLYTYRASVMEKASPVQEELMKSATPAATNAPPAGALTTPAAPATAPIVPASTPKPATPAPAAPSPATPDKPAAK
jgi:preprotein translocase subunit SecG